MTPEQRRKAIRQREREEGRVKKIMTFAVVVFALAGLAMMWLAIYMAIYFATSCQTGCDWASFGIVVASGILTGICLVGVRLGMGR